LAKLQDESFDIGNDTRTAVNDDYMLPFHFTGAINKLTFKLGPSQLQPTDQNTAEDAAKSADS
jgi:arylsulfatase